MKIKEIRDLSSKELVARKHELKSEIFRMRLQQRGGQLEKPSRFCALRREVARIETVLTEKISVAEAAAKGE